MKEPCDTHIPIWAIHRSIWHYNTSKCICFLFTCKIYIACIYIYTYIYIHIRRSALWRTKNICESSCQIHFWRTALLYAHQHTEITKMSRTKMSQNLKHQNTFKHMIQCFQIQRLPIHEYPTKPNTRIWISQTSPMGNMEKTAPFHPIPRWTPPRTFGNEAPTR